MNGIPLIVAALFLNAGILFYTGLQAAAVGLSGGRAPAYLTFAAICAIQGFLQLGWIAYWTAESVASVIPVLRIIDILNLLYLPALFAFIALYSRQHVIKPWLIAIGLFCAVLALANMMLPYGLRFSSLAFSGVMSLPWGDRVPRFSGEPTAWEMLRRMASLGIYLWAFYRAMSQFKGGRRREALFLIIFLALALGSLAINTLIEVRVLEFMYVIGIAPVVMALLMSIGMGIKLRERSAALKATERELCAEIARGSKTDEMIRNITAGCAGETGEAFFRQFVLHLARVFSAEHAWIGKIDWQASPRVTTLARCVRGKLEHNISYAFDDAPWGKTAAQRICAYPCEATRHFPDAKLLREIGAESYVAIALFNHEEKPGGVLVVADKKPLQDVKQAIAVIEIFAGRAAAEIGRQHATNELQAAIEELRQSDVKQKRLNRALRLLSDCSTALIHAEDEYKLLSQVCRLCVDSGGYLMAWVGYAVNDDRKTVRPVAQFGHEPGYLDQIHITWGDDATGRGPTGTAIRTGKPTVNQNVLTNPNMAPWRAAALRYGYQSSVALPLICERNQALGALTMYSKEPNAFDEDEVVLLGKMAGELAYGITNLRTSLAHKAAQEQVQFLSYFDPLTRLPNRLFLRERFENAVQIAQAAGSLVVLLYLDIDNFQNINDAYGSSRGDRLLVQVAQRLRFWLPASATISRIGADDFVALLPDMSNLNRVSSSVIKILNTFNNPFAIDDEKIELTCSVGVSIFPNDAKAFDNLLSLAALALHHAKEVGGNTYRFYAEGMNKDVLGQIHLMKALPSALRAQELVLHYQPQIDIRNGTIKGVEALIRWEHPTEGLLTPDRFISLAEQRGYIVQIGEWALREACRQAKAWLDTYAMPLVMAVNLSALQFKRSNLMQVVSSALAETGLPPSLLELELTESTLLNIEETRETLESLKLLGVKISIDDFGTGYSCLAYLQHLAIDKLKIDQAFVRDIANDTESAAIIKTIIQLGHALHLEVIAEGIETPEQHAFLCDAGCDEGQGYLYSRALPCDQFPKLFLLKNLAANALSPARS